MKPNHSEFAVVLTALTLLAVIHPASAGDLVPYQGEDVGVVTAAGFHPPFFALNHVTAEGEATHLGHYTLVGDFVVDIRFATATGTYTLTAANGDMLFLDMEGGAVLPAAIETIAHFTVTGGTGRFEGATGSFTSHNQNAFAVNLRISPNPYVGVIEGVISTVGSNKK